MINKMIKMKNKILAILAAPAAMPPNPNTAAMIANMIKVTVQRNIVSDLKVKGVLMPYQFPCYKDDNIQE